MKFGILLIGIIFMGCADKPIIKKELVVKKVYVKSKCPKLRTFDYNKTLSLTAYNKGNKICIKEWKACIPKEEMIKLIVHIKMLKEVNKKYKEEIEEYNKNFSN